MLFRCCFKPYREKMDTVNLNSLLPFQTCLSYCSNTSNAQKQTKVSLLHLLFALLAAYNFITLQWHITSLTHWAKINKHWCVISGISNNFITKRTLDICIIKRATNERKPCRFSTSGPARTSPISVMSQKILCSQSRSCEFRKLTKWRISDQEGSGMPQFLCKIVRKDFRCNQKV